MKHLTLILVCIICIAYCKGQPAVFTTDSTSVLPTGTYVKNGLVCVQKGYKAVLSADKKTVGIMKMRGNPGGSNGVSGTLACVCTKDGECDIILTPNGVKCGGSCGCILFTTITGSVAKAKWQRVILKK